MKRKSAPKYKHSKKTKFFTNSSTRNIAILITALAIILLAFLIKARSSIHVLGSATGPVLLAEDQPTHSPQPTGDQISSNQQSSSDTLVDCVKPDGTHFATSFHDCQELNQKMGQDTFHFTPLSKPDENNEQPEPTAEPTGEASHQNIETSQGHLEMQTEGNKGEINFETAGMHIEMKREDDGSVKIVAHQSDGTEIQLQTNAIEQINEALKEKDVEVSTSSANGFAIKSAGVQAETNFPLSIDPTTKSLAVTTSDGTKDVTTLPDAAVQNALQQGQLTNVLSTANQATSDATQGSNTVALTELNNQPVYAVQGVLNKNLLGLFPMAYRRTVYVSAQDGTIVQTQQAFFTQLLQAFSF